MPPAGKAGGIFTSGALLVRAVVTTVENYAYRSWQTAPRGLIGGAPVADEAQRKYRREPGFPVPILIAPATFWLIVFLFLPLISIFIFSFWKSTGHGMTPAFTLEHYRDFFVTEGFFDPKSADFLTPSVFLRTLWTTFRFTITVMAICLILAYPLAYSLRCKWKISNGSSPCSCWPWCRFGPAISFARSPGYRCSGAMG